MPYRDWLPSAPVGGVTVAVLAGLILAGLANQEPTKHPIKPSTGESQSADQAANDAPAVFDVAPTEPASSEHNQTGTDESTPHPREHFFLGDTWAQWLMASTGVLALIVSAWAVWLLRKTFLATASGTRAAQDAAKAALEANAILRSEQRAWITTTIEFSDDLVIDGNEVRLGVIVNNKNIGRTPAFRVQTVIELIIDDDDSPTERLDAMRSESNELLRSGRIVFPHQSYERPYELSATKPSRFSRLYMFPCIIVCTTYEIAGDKDYHQTGLIYYLSTGPDRSVDDLIATDATGVSAGDLRAHVVLGGFAD